MKNFLSGKRFLIATLAIIGLAAWTANNEEVFYSAAQHFNGTVYLTVPASYSHNTSAITAHAGGGQASATALTKEYNNVSVIATNADSVKLPTAYAGAHVVIENTDSAQTLAVYGASGASIDTGSANASISVLAGSMVELWGTSATTWSSSQSLCVASGAGSFTTLAASSTLAVTGAATLSSTLTLASVSAGVTAATGSSQGDGAITSLATQVTTAAVSGDAQTLPAAAVGKVQIVCNAAASNPIDVFPVSGTQINKETANVAISLAAGECMLCVGFSTTRWGCTIGSAN